MLVEWVGVLGLLRLVDALVMPPRDVEISLSIMHIARYQTIPGQFVEHSLNVREREVVSGEYLRFALLSVVRVPALVVGEVP